MPTKDKATCSICGKEDEYINMSTNKVFEEERCRECMQLYGDVPLETLLAALSHGGLEIKELSREDRDNLITLQKEKIALNRETEKKIEKLEKAKFVLNREKKIEETKEKAKTERAMINQEIDDLIKTIKAEMEAPARTQ